MNPQHPEDDPKSMMVTSSDLSKHGYEKASHLLARMYLSIRRPLHMLLWVIVIVGFFGGLYLIGSSYIHRISDPKSTDIQSGKILP